MNDQSTAKNKLAIRKTTVKNLKMMVRSGIKAGFSIGPGPSPEPPPVKPIRCA